MCSQSASEVLTTAIPICLHTNTTESWSIWFILPHHRAIGFRTVSRSRPWNIITQHLSDNEFRPNQNFSLYLLRHLLFVRKQIWDVSILPRMLVDQYYYIIHDKIKFMVKSKIRAQLWSSSRSWYTGVFTVHVRDWEHGVLVPNVVVSQSAKRLSGTALLSYNQGT